MGKQMIFSIRSNMASYLSLGSIKDKEEVEED